MFPLPVLESRVKISAELGLRKNLFLTSLLESGGGWQFGLQICMDIYPWLVATSQSLCLCIHTCSLLCVFTCPFYRTPVIAFGAHPNPVWPCLKSFHLPRPYLQMRSHSQVPGVRTSSYLFRSTIQPIAGWLAVPVRHCHVVYRRSVVELCQWGWE